MPNAGLRDEDSRAERKGGRDTEVKGKFMKEKKEEEQIFIN